MRGQTKNTILGAVGVTNGSRTRSLSFTEKHTNRYTIVTIKVGMTRLERALCRTPKVRGSPYSPHSDSEASSNSRSQQPSSAEPPMRLELI